MASPDVQAVISLPGDLNQDQLEYVQAQLGRVAEAMHHGQMCAVVAIPKDATQEEVEMYSESLDQFNAAWWNREA